MYTHVYSYYLGGNRFTDLLPYTGLNLNTIKNPVVCGRQFRGSKQSAEVLRKNKKHESQNIYLYSSKPCSDSDNQKVWKTMMQSYHHVAATDGAQETDELEVRLGE